MSRPLLFIALGAVLGGLFGHFNACRSGACPLTAISPRFSHFSSRGAARVCSGKEDADFGGGLCVNTLTTGKIQADAASA